jgi:hypothetical protein
MNNEAIIAKIQKLLARADEDRNDNEHERAIALRQAHSLLARHGLNADDVLERSVDPLGPLGRLTVGVDFTPWQRSVTVCVAELYGVFGYRDSNGVTKFCGRKARTLVARDVLLYLLRSVEREVYAALKSRPANSALHGKTFRRSFCTGAAIGIATQVESILADLRKGELDGEQLAPGQALVLVNQHALAVSEAKAALPTTVNPDAGKTKKVTVNANAFERGRRFGETVSINNQLSGSATPARRIGVCE